MLSLHKLWNSSSRNHIIMHKSLFRLRRSPSLKSWHADVFASKTKRRIRLAELSCETWDKKIKTKIAQTSLLMWMPGSFSPLRKPWNESKPVQSIDSPSGNYDLIYWSYYSYSDCTCAECALAHTTQHIWRCIRLLLQRHKPTFST